MEDFTTSEPLPRPQPLNPCLDHPQKRAMSLSTQPVPLCGMGLCQQFNFGPAQACSTFLQLTGGGSRVLSNAIISICVVYPSSNALSLDSPTYPVQGDGSSDEIHAVCSAHWMTIRDDKGQPVGCGAGEELGAVRGRLRKQGCPLMGKDRRGKLKSPLTSGAAHAPHAQAQMQPRGKAPPRH